MESPRRSKKSEWRGELTDAQRLNLINEVGQVLFDRTESWEPDNVGSDLAYLFWAIAYRGREYFTMSRKEPRKMVEMLHQLLPPEHPVWLFIEEVA